MKEGFKDIGRAVKKGLEDRRPRDSGWIQGYRFGSEKHIQEEVTFLW
jgi:hypothetical protein